MKSQHTGITAQAIRDAFDIVNYDQILKLREIINASKEKTFPKQCFIALIEESVELAKFHQSIKNINEKIVVQKEGNKQQISYYNGQYQTLKKEMKKSKRGLLQTLNTNMESPKILFQVLSKYCNDSKEEQKLQSAIAELPPSFQVQNIQGSIAKYHALKQEVQLIHESYLSKFKAFLRTFKAEEQSQFQEIQQTTEMKHVQAQLRKYIEKSASLLKNAQFYFGIVDYLKKFIDEMLSPLREREKDQKDISNIVVSKEDIRTQFERVLQAYRKYIKSNDQNSANFLIQSNNHRGIETNLRQQLKQYEATLLEKENLLQQINYEKQSYLIRLENVNQQNKAIRQKLSATLDRLSQIRQTLDSNKNQWVEQQSNLHRTLTEQLTNLAKPLKNFDKKFNQQQLKIQDLSKQLKITTQTLEIEKQNLKLFRLQAYQSQKIIQAQKAAAVESQKKAKFDLETIKREKESILQSQKSSIQGLKAGYQQRLIDVQQQSQRFKKEKSQYFYEQFFNNDILFDRLPQKQYICDSLFQRYNRKLRTTRLIFRFDPLNKVNFHRYVDNIPNILVLLKLQNGRIIVVYTPHAFEIDCRGDEAMLMVVNTRKNFFLRPGQRAISYDQYYLLFGNSEVRLRSGEDLVFSNFGIANCYFQNNRNTVDALLGQGKDVRQVPIQGYEIYQLIFAE